MLRNIFSLVVRKHAVFLRIVDDGISREIELCFFAVDLYLLLRKRCFESVGGTFVVSTKDNGVAAFHFEAQFIVVLANPGKLLTNRRFNGLVVAAFSCGVHFGVQPQPPVVNVESQSAILKQSPAF